MTTRHNQGFTVIELLMVIGILIILTTILLLSFLKLNSSQALSKDAVMVRSVLNQAHNLSLSSKGNNQYGVHFNTSSVVIFIGPTYSSADTNNIVTNLNTNVSVATALAGGGANVLFDRLTGKTSQSGTVTLSLVPDPSKTKTITVFSTGVIQ